MYKNQPSIINQGYCNEKIIVVKFSRFETPWQVELKLNGLSRTLWSTQTALSNAGTHTHSNDASLAGLFASACFRGNWYLVNNVMNFKKTLNCISRVYYKEFQYNQMVTIPGCQFMQYIRNLIKARHLKMVKLQLLCSQRIAWVEATKQLQFIVKIFENCKTISTC